MQRIENLGIGIHGIEPWLNGSYFDVYSSEDYGTDSCDPKWYNSAINDFAKKEGNLIYAASYFIPDLE